MLSRLNVGYINISPPPPDLSTLSLHDALPISRVRGVREAARREVAIEARLVDGVDRPEPHAHGGEFPEVGHEPRDRKSTRLNSSHTVISYAVFCLKKKTTQRRQRAR